MPGVNTLYCFASGVHLRRLDDEMVVYLADRFETHLIDDVGGQILEAVQQMQSAARPCSVSALYAWLSYNSDVDTAVQVASEADVVLKPLLGELVRIGVITIQAC